MIHDHFSDHHQLPPPTITTTTKKPFCVFSLVLSHIFLSILFIFFCFKYIWYKTESIQVANASAKYLEGERDLKMKRYSTSLR